MPKKSYTRITFIMKSYLIVKMGNKQKKKKKLKTQNKQKNQKKKTQNKTK